MSLLEQKDCDVVVIGGGVAGMVAAVRAAQGRLRVKLLEQRPEEIYPCNSRLTAGVWHCCATDILADPNALYEKVMAATDEQARPDLARAVAEDGQRVVRWMQSVGVRFMKGPYSYQSFVLAPPSVTSQGCDWRGRGGDVMLRTLEKALGEFSGELLRGHRATALMHDEGCVGGVSGMTADGQPFRVTAHAVVIADGGFQSNHALIAQAITPAPEKVFQRNAGTAQGDGLQMARDAGAHITGLGGFYGHVLSRDAYTNDRLSPYPYLDYLATAGVVLDRHARRFTDEGRGGVAVANAIAASADPLGKFVIVDERIWRECGVVRLVSPNPYLVKAGAAMYQADTLEALAVSCGLGPQALSAAIAEYNAAVKAGNPSALAPVRTSASHEARPIETAPFYAFPVCAGITYTMGGIGIDADGQVLAASGDAVISGLYAAGCATGGLEGGPKGGYVGGLVKSGVTALRAAEHILATIPSR